MSAKLMYSVTGYTNSDFMRVGVEAVHLSVGITYAVWYVHDV